MKLILCDCGQSTPPRHRAAPNSMNKLENVDWADSIGFSSFGIKIGIRVNRPNAIHEVIHRLPPCREPIVASNVDVTYSLIFDEIRSWLRPRRYAFLYESNRQLGKSTRIVDIYDLLETTIQMRVAEFSHDRIFVHSGVVGLNGRAVLIPGRSYSGKSTLVSELIKAGAVYYSDEYAVLDSDGMVHPYPRPLALRIGESGTQIKFPPDSFGARTGNEPLKPGLVLITRFDAEAKWSPDRISSGEGALELLANTVPARTRPVEAMSSIRNALADSMILKSPRGEAGEVVNFVMNYSGD